MMMKYDYIDSGIDWIGEVPKHWKMEKLKYVTNLIIDGTHFTPDYIDSDDGIAFLRVTDIQTEFIDLNRIKRISFEEHCQLNKRCNPEKGDLLLSKNGTIGLTKVVDWDFPCSLFVSLCLIKPMKKIEVKYLNHLFIGGFFEQQISDGSKATTVTNLHLEKIKEFKLLFPSKPEQTAIAAYLDKACADIDRVVEIKRKQLDNLQQQLKSIIHHAVTKGLNDKAEMKDSGIEWIGKVPKHWKKRRIKDIVSLQSGDNITSDQITEDDEFPVYGGNGLRGYYSNFTHEGIFALIGRQGALCGNINYANGKFWASEHAIVATPINRVETVWLGEILRTMNLNQYSNSAAQPGLSVEKIKNLYFIVPPFPEQEEITKYIHINSERIKTAQTKIEKQIEILLSYKKSLIHEVVTGKKQVFGLAGETTGAE
jgi:type I restriction enzyme S subunit